MTILAEQWAINPLAWLILGAIGVAGIALVLSFVRIAIWHFDQGRP